MLQARTVGFAGLLDTGPQPRTIVVVEGDPDTALTRARQCLQQFGTPLLAKHCQGNAAEIQHVVAGQRCQDRLGRRGHEAVAHGSFVAPVEETPLTIGVGLDAVEPRQASRQALHLAQTDALVRPDPAHRIAEAVVAQRRDVVDLGPLTQQSGKVYRGIERVAAEALAQAAISMLLQFDHAFADKGDPGKAHVTILLQIF